jgi:hypothetical protein
MMRIARDQMPLLAKTKAIVVRILERGLLSAFSAPKKSTNSNTNTSVQNSE